MPDLDMTSMKKFMGSTAFAAGAAAFVTYWLAEEAFPGIFYADEDKRQLRENVTPATVAMTVAALIVAVQVGVRGKKFLGESAVGGAVLDETMVGSGNAAANIKAAVQGAPMGASMMGDGYGTF
jgi:hypothetical protein